MAKIVCHVVIVGCGLGGLAAAIALKRQGHDVTVLEQAGRLSETGAGIQIPPNSARILKSWGLLPALEAYAVEPDALILRAYQNGSVLSEAKVGGVMRDMFHVPWFLIHRADYFNVLVMEARRLGIQIRLNCAVSKIDWRSDGQVLVIIKDSAGLDIRADVVIGADGLNSRCRGMMVRDEEPLRMTRGFVHRVGVDAGDIRVHSGLVELLGASVTNTWIGPGAHVAAYPVKGSDVYNFVFICEVRLETLGDLKEFFKDWDPRLRLVLDIARDVKQWPLNASIGNDRWVHPEGNFALLGDACHAMFPYLAQGAAQAVEDGAVLGTLLGSLTNKADIRDRLLLYEELRKPRATRVRDLSGENLQIFHMLEGAEGSEQYANVKSFAFGGSRGVWAEAGFRDWLFGHDVVREAEEMRDGKGRERESSD